jgi:hypothetical protein
MSNVLTLQRGGVPIEGYRAFQTPDELARRRRALERLAAAHEANNEELAELPRDCRKSRKSSTRSTTSKLPPKLQGALTVP